MALACSSVTDKLKKTSFDNLSNISLFSFLCSESNYPCRDLGISCTTTEEEIGVSLLDVNIDDSSTGTDASMLVEDSVTGVVATDASMLVVNVENSVTGMVATDASILTNIVFTLP